MGRPEKLTGEMKTYLTKLKLGDKQKPASELIRELKIYLVEKTSKQYPGMTKEDVEKLVEDEQLSRTAIIDFNTELNHRLKTPSELDKPWHILTLSKHDLPADAIPTILEIWLDRLRMKGSMPLTIREAKWVARLYRTIPDIRLLEINVTQYALDEKIAEFIGLAKRIDSNPHEAMQYDNFATIDDAHLYNHMTNKFVRLKFFDKEGKEIPEGSLFPDEWSIEVTEVLDVRETGKFTEEIEE